MLKRLRDAIVKFRADQQAVAAVEFALIMPYLLALYFGSKEASVLFTADKRVNSISSTVGDLVSQWDPSDGNLPDATTLQGYFAAAKGLIAPYSNTNLTQVVSLIFVKSDGTTKVLWSRAYGGGTARTAGLSYAPLALGNAAMMNTISRGGCIVAAEASYSYKPLLGEVFPTALTLSHINYFIPRNGATVVIRLDTTSTASVPTTACTT